jgi:hypothetical protein
MTLAADDDIVVGGTQWGALYANDAKTGRKLWSRSDHGLSNRGASAALHDGLIYIISDRSVFIIDGKSGRIITRREMPFSVDATSTPLQVTFLLLPTSAATSMPSRHRSRKCPVTEKKVWPERVSVTLFYLRG